MKTISKYLMICLASLVVFACGGGGGGSDSDSNVTPLDVSDSSTENGTYKVLEMEYYYSNGNHFTTNDLDSFSGKMVINSDADTVQSEVEWHDSIYGDYYDFDEDSLSNPSQDSGTTYDNYYYSITDDYTVKIYYENMCGDGFCADASIILRKTSDSTAPIMVSGASVAAASVPDDDGLISRSMRYVAE